MVAKENKIKIKKRKSVKYANAHLKREKLPVNDYQTKIRFSNNIAAYSKHLENVSKVVNKLS